MAYKIEINQKVKVAEDGLKKVVEETLKTAAVQDAEISIAIVSDKEIKELNKKYRGKNKVTDVLSFGYRANPLIGEIIICLPQVKRQAKENNANWKNELIFMLIHGVLHLCGYDHEKSEKEARKMERIQDQICESLIQKNNF